MWSSHPAEAAPIANPKKLLTNLLKPLKEPKVRLCPRCKSTELQLSSWLDIWLLPEVYVCKSCGYRGPLVLELTRTEGGKA